MEKSLKPTIEEAIRSIEPLICQKSRQFAHGSLQADDLAQEARIKLLMAWPTFRHTGEYAQKHFMVWAMRIVTHHMIDLWRSSNRLQTISFRAQENDQEAGEPGDYTDCEIDPHWNFTTQMADRDSLNELLLKISEDRRLVVLLIAQGYGYEEIAAHMGLPIGTIRSKLFRARKDLQRYYAESA